MTFALCTNWSIYAHTYLRKYEIGPKQRNSTIVHKEFVSAYPVFQSQACRKWSRCGQNDLIEYLIHFRSNNAKKDLSLSFVQIKRRERKKQTQTWCDGEQRCFLAGVFRHAHNSLFIHYLSPLLVLLFLHYLFIPFLLFNLSLLNIFFIYAL